MSGLPKSDGKIIPLRLPDLPHEGQPGSRFVHRSVSVTLMVLGLLLAAAVAVSALVKMDVTVKAFGVLEPVRIYPLRAQEGGTVREVLVHTGDTVRAGQVLARLDTLELAATLAQLDAQRRAADIDLRRSATAEPLQQRQTTDRSAQAQARLVSALASLRQRMVEYDLGTNTDSLLAAHVPGRHVAVDLAVGEVRSAQADLRVQGSEGGLQALSRFDREKLGTQMDELAAQMRTVRARMDRLKIVAPTDGIVLTEQLERLPGAFAREGETLMEVADLNEWRVQLTVPERDAHRISVGDSVKVEIQAFRESERELLGGHVVYVSPEALGAADADAGGGAAAAPTRATGPGVYRVIGTLNAGDVRKTGIDNLRRGYTVQGNVITRSGRILVLLWDYLTDKLDR